MSFPSKLPLRTPGQPLWSSVRGRLLILVLAVTLPALLLALLLTWEGYRHERVAAETNLKATARAMSAAIDRQLAEYFAFAQSLATSDAIRHDDLAGLEARARSLTNGTDRWVVLGDVNGQQLVNTWSGAKPPLPKVDLPEEMWTALRAKRGYVSNLTIGPLTQRPLLYTAVPVFRGDQLKYVLAFVVEPSALTSEFNVAKIAPGSILSVLDRTGTIAARSRLPEKFVGQKATPDMVAAVAQHAEGAISSRTLEGIDVLTAFYRDPKSGWSVIIGAPKDVVFSGAWHILRLGLGFSMGLMVLTGLIAFSIARAVVTDVEQVVAEGEVLSRGTIPPARPSALTEFDRLSVAMRGLMTQLVQRERENAKFAAIVASSNDAIISCNLEGRIEIWNPAAERMFGYTVSEAIGSQITRLIPVHRADEEELVFAAVRSGKSVSQLETERMHKDGHAIRVYLSVSPVRDSTGTPVGASAIVHDVTAQRRTEERQQAVHELVATVNRANALLPIYEAVFVALSRCYGASNSAILLAPEKTSGGLNLARASTEGFEPSALAGAAWLEPHAVDTPRRIAVNDGALPDPLREALRALDLANLVVVPLRLENRRLGYLVFGESSGAANPDANSELQTAETVASQVAFAIHRQQGAEALEALVAERTASLRQVIAQMEEFSYSVSHDLRSPVRAISGYAEALLDDFGAKLDASAKHLVVRIGRIAARMDQLTRDLLTYSRLNQREVTLAPVAVDKLVADVIAEYPELHPERADVEVRGPLPGVIGHEPSLSQALSNLLTNAVKFVRPESRPRIVISAEERGNMTRIWVEDNGIGIKPEHQARLFGLFERLHPATQFEGTGVGLAIVRKAVERMGGKVGLESDGVSGSRFWFELPSANGNNSGDGATGT